MNPSKIPGLLPVIIFSIIGIGQISFGANIFVPEMDLTSKMYLSSMVETRIQSRVSLDGGYKYQAKIFFQCYDTDLETGPPPVLTFDGAQATIRDIFNIFDFTYFTGYYGILGEGEHYKGYLYHGESGFDYNGYRPIQGTGFIFSADHYDLIKGQLFVYSSYGGFFNAIDLLFGVDKDPFIFQLFLGTSEGHPEIKGTDLVYRIGTQFKYLGDDIDFFLTIGNPLIEIGHRIVFDDFYFLLEEWIKMNNWNLILSVFARPKVHYNYIQKEYIDTGETNDIDFNFDLNYAPEARYFSVGGEFNMQTNKTEPYGIFISPYINIFASGLAWKLKLDFNILSQLDELLTAYVNVSASF